MSVGFTGCKTVMDTYRENFITVRVQIFYVLSKKFTAPGFTFSFSDTRTGLITVGWHKLKPLFIVVWMLLKQNVQGVFYLYL